MPHFAKPYYKASRATWYAEFNHKQYSLGPNPAHRPTPRKKNGVWDAPIEILSAFDDLKLRLRQSIAPSAILPHGAPTGDEAGEQLCCLPCRFCGPIWNCLKRSFAGHLPIRFRG
jgi:hypothetical protein